MYNVYYLYYILHCMKFVSQDGNQYRTVRKCTHNTNRDLLQSFQKILLMIIRHT